MSKTVACSYPGSERSREQCCTQKLVQTQAALTGKGLVTLKLGESRSSDWLGSSTDLSADLGRNGASQGWTWPAGLSVLVPRIVGTGTLVAGRSTPSAMDMTQEYFMGLMETGGCTTSSLLGTVHAGERPQHDNFRSGGVSTTQRRTSLDVWVADMPYCLFDDTKAYKVLNLWHEECLSTCGHSGNNTRILHVDAATSKVSTVLTNTTGVFLDVAASAIDHHTVQLAVLHLGSAEIKSAYTGGPKGIAKILRPTHCPDKPGCTCAPTCHLNDPGMWDDDARLTKLFKQRWGGSLKNWNEQRGLRGWPLSGNVTAPRCIQSPCACCFHTCPSYTVYFGTVKTSSLEFILGSRLSINSSCIIPSIAADQSKVYILTSRALEMYSHKGKKLFTWQSNELEYTGFFEPDFYVTKPESQKDWGKGLRQGGRFKGGLPRGEDGIFLHQFLGRMGGQIALDNSGAATEVYFTSSQGHLFQCKVENNPESSTVTVLLKSDVHAFVGATLQTYSVPGIQELQKRLYVTRLWARQSDRRVQNWKARHSIHRINLNALQRWVKVNGTLQLHVKIHQPTEPGSRGTFPLRGTFADDANEQLWNQFAKAVTVESNPKVANAFTRLAYAQGKLYYLRSSTIDPAKTRRATLSSTDVTLFVDCDHAFSLVNNSFHNWVITPDDYEKSFEAGQPRNESLHETSKYAGTFPWQFRAFKKVVPWDKHLVVKEMLCSRPKPPTTRPSQEKCCVRKRIEANTVRAPHKTGQCKLKDLMKQL